MDRCSPELVALIFEFACAEDLGGTARRLGLVSKSFRAFAEPIERRSIAVSGVEQLRGAVSRIDKAQISPALALRGEGVQNIAVRHLFVSELTKEHAILADSRFRNRWPGQRGSFWISEEGRKAQWFYYVHSEEFWRLAGELVRKTGPTLKTVALLSSSNWFSWRGEGDLDSVKLDRPKVLGVLSGITMLNLVSLTINHYATFELRHFGDDGSLFEPPTLPALRQLRIVSCIYTDTYVRGDRLKHPHPLLACLLSKYPNAEQLILCSVDMGSVENVMRAIFGPRWRGVLSGGKLPGNLRSVVLQQGIEPARICRTDHIDDWDGTHYWDSIDYWDSVRNFANEVVGLNVPGLEAKDPSHMFPKDGEREYELLLSDWKSQCVAGLS